VAAVEHDVLAHRTAREGRHPLDRRRLVCRGGDDDRVVHRPRIAEALVDLCDGRGLLPDRDVDADHVAVALIQDRVDQDRGLPRRAVADDQLTLAAADVRHRVDRLDPGLEWLFYGLAIDDPRRLELERPPFVGLDRRAAVERVPEGVDDPADEGVSDRDARDLAGPLDRLAFLDQLPVAEERGADVVLLEVEGDPGDAVLELEHLRRDGILEAVDTGDPVADLEHGADLGEVGLDVVLLDALPEDRRNLFRSKFHARLSPSGSGHLSS
jgi:hypothetical protein